MTNSALGNRSLCAVVPAAGRGSRLGLDLPKVFVPLSPTATIWDAIHEQLSKVADRIVLVLSPEGNRYLAEHRKSFPPEKLSGTRIACQHEPLGMGDAIFGSADLWREAENVLIVWGDQFNLSVETLRACLDLHSAQRGPALTIPLVRMAQPYVEYIYDSADKLTAIRQSREGEPCAPDGLADMGVFLLTGGQALIEEWNRFRATSSFGAVTGEINFLPFLVHLSSTAGWATSRHESHDPDEALGINTPEDLARARQIHQAKSIQPGKSY